jgi:hypothetical protein
MPLFSPICSLAMMDRLRFHACLGRYHLLLAHKVLEDPKGWGTFFKNRARNFNGIKPFVIMDNSLIELGKSLPAEDIARAAECVDATCAVLPDALTNGYLTAQLSYETAPLLREALPKGCKLMGVVQGETWDEYLWCADTLVRECEVDYLCVPRITYRMLGSRLPITDYLWELYEKPIHLLGFSEFIPDDIATAVSCQGVLGIDSTLPLRLGFDGKKLIHHWRDQEPRPKAWLDFDAPIPDEAVGNLALIRKWLLEQ